MPKVITTGFSKMLGSCLIICAVIGIGYLGYVVTIARLGRHNLPTNWTSKIGGMNFAEIHRTLGPPQDDACAKQYQNWIDEHWWGRRLLKIVARDCDPASRPEEVWIFVYAEGRYAPVYHEILFNRQK